MVDSLELVCGSGYSQEKVAQIINAGWAADPVHPNKHIYAKAALNLMEKMAEPAAATDMVRPRTPGSTAAETTEGITAAAAVMTADTTRHHLKEGRG